MNKEQQELVGDAYKRFLNETIKIEPIDAKQRAIEQLLNSKESKEEFINKIKTDDEFAKKWGLKIEERELSSQERKNIYDNSSWEKDMFPTDINGWNKLFDGYNIPTKLITITYNDKTIESYE
jgi:hypothetical protein